VGGKRIVTGARNTVTGNSPSMAHQSVTVTEIVASEVMTAAAHGVASKSMSSVSAQPMNAQPMTNVGCAAVGGKPMKPTAPTQSMSSKPVKPTASAKPMPTPAAKSMPTPTATTAPSTTATLSSECRDVRHHAERANRNARGQNAYCSLLHGRFPTRSSKTVVARAATDVHLTAISAASF
jgi:hypothetical protein